MSVSCRCQHRLRGQCSPVSAGISVWPDVPAVLVWAPWRAAMCVHRAGFTHYVLVCSTVGQTAASLPALEDRYRRRAHVQLSSDRGQCGSCSHRIAYRPAWSIPDAIATGATVATVLLENAVCHTAALRYRWKAPAVPSRWSSKRPVAAAPTTATKRMQVSAA